MMSSRTKIGSLFSDVTFYVNEAPVLCFLPLDRIGEKTKELKPHWQFCKDAMPVLHAGPLREGGKRGDLPRV